MAKTFATNSDTVKAFVRGNCDEGKSSSGVIFFKDGVIYSYGHHFPMAVDCGKYYIVNGDKYSRTTSKHQSYLFNEIPNNMRLEIPFSALEAMSNNSYKFLATMIKDMDVVSWEKDSYVDTGRVSEITGEKLLEHSLGGVLFKWNERWFISGLDITGSNGSRYFLTELDAGQIKKYGEPNDVAAAYELLKPDAVKVLESAGTEFKRQGEWFFIRRETPVTEIGTKNYSLVNANNTGTLAHIATEGFMSDNGIQYVRGIIKHSGGEHKQLKLYEVGTKERPWYAAFESVQGQSWSAAGNVD